MLSCGEQQVLPIRSDRIAIRPACVARFEGTVVPAHDLECRRLTDATPADGVNDLTTAEEQIPDFGTRADADDALATGQAFHLNEVSEARTVQVGPKTAFAHGVRK